MKRIICHLLGHDLLYSAVVGHVVSPKGWGAITWDCRCVRCGLILRENIFNG